MMDHTIITIGRQFGSGGHEVGKQTGRETEHSSLRSQSDSNGSKRSWNYERRCWRVDETRLGNVLSSYYIGMGDYTTFMLSPEVEKPLSDQLFDAQ